MGVGVTVNDKPSMSQQCHTVVKMASVTLRYTETKIRFLRQESILLFYPALARTLAGHCTPGKRGVKENSPKGRNIERTAAESRGKCTR